ncbi:Panacea domain-containing protein [Rathayibacter rathayi]|uniref:DUF4065 domain-containing protein n=3 Tax=Rathayibacter rathayi TaxID=33887 RepID=A0ABD6W7P7_RATRA|nr:type II toxin-antitoxin system antitoxin SocA domain-containing protein [Rathayibacter rathayi]AZZ49577.1 DUF4065 domain-containing protein [Rathayibacter rathayi]MWV73700.1 DUF4065 domain-containing protein [Rathayibacter rathayi NCPPB 2980 = VKM Ac-1601]PPF12941.1 DUF4065 domain-containing protein [Rathayibacter rathayi]PPF24124.1 DUF4065 domain-containing protein [Rathayibacter rathayi]PPF48035.1 DUF4065 domain-containing protein [Rathayibacter rathayi]
MTSTDLAVQATALSRSFGSVAAVAGVDLTVRPGEIVAFLSRGDSMKIQKLVYFAQAWHLAWTGRPIFDEDFEAWPKGPVVRSVVRENRYTSLPAHLELNDDVRATLDSVLDFYGHRGYQELVEFTHVDAPWIDARRGLDAEEPSRRIVKRDTLLDFYSSRAIEGGDGPERRAHVENADTDETGSLARSMIDRWTEGLALLANK